MKAKTRTKAFFFIDERSESRDRINGHDRASEETKGTIPRSSAAVLIPFIFLLFVVGFFTGCSNVTEPGLTNAELLVSRNSQRVQTLSEMSEQECVEFIIQNNITIPDGFPNLAIDFNTKLREC